MASNHTEHYELNQWSASDPVLREDFNADNATIDAALAGKARIVAGTYSTPSTLVVNTPHHVSLGFRPKAVLIWRDEVSSLAIYLHGQALLTDGIPLQADFGGIVAAIEDDGFYVQNLHNGKSHYYPNLTGSNVRYIAFA